MKTITKTYNIYKYEELSEKAKEKVKEWYLNDDIRPVIFKEDIENILSERFKNSDLKVYFSLAYCQGDGLNIEGRLNLDDFVDFWNASEKEKRTIKKYIANSIYYYDFYKNNRYCYSCKFLDKKYIDDAIDEFIEELKYQCFKNIKEDIIKNFFNDMIDYFEELDREYENAGYKYFYEIDEEELEETCNINEWYFDINGGFSLEAC
jgi:hypothetical protein